MIRFFKAFFIVLTLTALGAAQGLNDIGITKTLALGDLKTTSAGKIVLETKDGEISAILASSTQYQRLPPDNLKLSAAKPAAFTDLAEGDRVLVLGKVSEDRKTIVASRVFLVKGSELEELARKQRREWRMRGIAGKVEAIDPASKVVTVKISSITGSASSLALTAKDDAKFLKYAPTSVRYSDAVDSEFSKIEVGDNIQALGDRSQDGKSFQAEEILTGSFVTVAGTVESVNVGSGEVVIKHFNTKENVTIKVNDGSTLKKFPDEMASRIARFLQFSRAGGFGGGGNRAGGGSRGGNAGNRRAGNTSQNQGNAAGNRGNRGNRGGQGGGRRGMRGGPAGMGDINTIANRIPDIKLADLKKGDQIAASSPKSKDEKNYIAIKLIAGIGPFIVAQSKSGGRARGVGGSLQIPGLDSVEF